MKACGSPGGFARPVSTSRRSGQGEASRKSRAVCPSLANANEPHRGCAPGCRHRALLLPIRFDSLPAMSTPLQDDSGGRRPAPPRRRFCSAAWAPPSWPGQGARLVHPAVSPGPFRACRPGRDSGRPCPRAWRGHIQVERRRGDFRRRDPCVRQTRLSVDLPAAGVRAPEWC